MIESVQLQTRLAIQCSSIYPFMAFQSRWVKGNFKAHDVLMTANMVIFSLFHACALRQIYSERGLLL